MPTSLESRQAQGQSWATSNSIRWTSPTALVGGRS